MMWKWVKNLFQTKCPRCGNYNTKFINKPGNLAHMHCDDCGYNW